VITRPWPQGFSAGQDAVHADQGGAYALYRGDQRVARFGFNRIQVRLSWSELSGIL
jgi:hypothetical protein